MTSAHALVSSALAREAQEIGVCLDQPQLQRLADAAIQALERPSDSMIDLLMDNAPTPFEMDRDRDAYARMFKAALVAP